MEVVAAALGNDLYLRVGVASILGVEVVGDDIELLDGIDRQSSGAAFPRGRDVGSGRIVDSNSGYAASLPER